MTDVQRYVSSHTLAETGYTAASFVEPIDDPLAMRWTWRGEGNGAGTLEIRGTEHYVAGVLNAFQHQPVLRYCTHAVGVDKGDLDIGSFP